MGARPIQRCARVRIAPREAIDMETRVPVTRNCSYEHLLPPMVDAPVRIDTYHVAAMPDSDIRRNPIEKFQRSGCVLRSSQMVRCNAVTQRAAHAFLVREQCG